MHHRLFAVICLHSLASSAFAGVLDVFARDQGFAGSYYRLKFNSGSSCSSMSTADVLTGSSSTSLPEIIETTVTTTITIPASVSSPSCVQTLSTETKTVTLSATSTKTVTITAAWSSSSSDITQTVFVQPSTCLSNAQATNIVSAYHNMLTNPDRSTVNTTAADLIAEDFMEMSGTINLLSGQGVTNTTFPTRSNYLSSLTAAPAIPMMTTLDIFYDCNRIAWYWAVTGLGSGVDEVRGISLIYTIPQALEAAAAAATQVGGTGNGTVTPGSAGYGNRKVNMLMLEFNGIAWAEDTGRTLCKGGCAAS